MENDSSGVYLSIVIPAYNEEKKIGRDIEAAAHFFEKQNIRGEIIVVNDGSDDNTSGVVSRSSREISAKIISVNLPENRGKGAAIREGVARSSGLYVLYADAGLTIDFEESLKGIELIKKGECHAAFASRKLKDSVIEKGYGVIRKALSRVFVIFTKYAFGIPDELTDTQCGFKIFKGDIARGLFADLRMDGYLFELEIIHLTMKNGYKMKEFPVSWRCDRESSLGIFKSAPRIIREIAALKKVLRR